MKIFQLRKEKSLQRKQKQYIYIKKEAIEILQIKNTISELKNSLDGHKIQTDMKVENVSEYADRVINIIQSEEQKED